VYEGQLQCTGPYVPRSAPPPPHRQFKDTEKPQCISDKDTAEADALYAQYVAKKKVDNGLRDV
jgi:hypothetical protein